MLAYRQNRIHPLETILCLILAIGLTTFDINLACISGSAVNFFFVNFVKKNRRYIANEFL